MGQSIYMNQEFKETLQGQLQQIEEIFDSITSIYKGLDNEDEQELIDDVLAGLDNAIDNIKLLIQ